MTTIIERVLERVMQFLPGIFIQKPPTFSIKDHETIIKSGTPPTYPNNYTLRIDEPVNMEMELKYNVTLELKHYYRPDNSITLQHTLTRNEGEIISLIYSLGLDDYYITLEQISPR